MSRNPKSPSPPLLEVRGIRKTFAARDRHRRREQVVAAQDVAFRLERGQAVALVGESGSGKSTIARMLLRLETPEGGEILLDGADVLSSEPRRASLRFRGRIQMVFQDPFGSLNPVHSVAHHLERPLIRHRRAASGTGARARAIELLHVVGLEPAEEFIDRHPYELSGGQRQRVAIARALAVEPDVLVADEPTSMLDVSIRMGILNLLAELKRDRGLAILLITHDLASARFLADRILVLFAGRVVEEGASDEVVNAPAHPYTRALLASIADSGRLEQRAARAHGTPADRSSGRADHGDRPNVGCPFATRCPDVFEPCRSVDPAARAVDGRRVRCHLYPDGSPALGGHAVG